MRRLLLWSTLTVVVLLAAVAGLYWAYWSLHARFQPRVVAEAAEVQTLLDEAGWVSDGGGGAPLYLIGWRDCESCLRYQLDEFPMLRAAGVEPRVILFARPDRDGLPRSTASERSTVAELWVTRDWTLFQRWAATPSRNWTAAGIPAADGNAARTGVVEQGRAFQARLETALRASGVTDISYPLILWRDAQGTLKVCACSDPRAYAFVRDDLGTEVRASDVAPAHRTAEPVQVEIDDAVPYPEVAPPPATEIRPNVMAPGEVRDTPPVRRPTPRPEARPEPETRRPTPRPPEARPQTRPSEPTRRPPVRQPEPRRPEPRRPEPRPTAPRQPETRPPETRRPPAQPPRPTNPPFPREEEDDTMFY